MTANGRMNAGERQALRQVVKQRMKVLRSDVSARRAELAAEIAERVSARFASRRKVVTDLNEVVAGILDQANKDIRTAVDKVRADHDGLALVSSAGVVVTGPTFGLNPTEQREMHARLYAELDAQVAAALVNIDRQEADLIQELCVDGLQTDAARNYLNRIPTVGDLVPASRMREIAG